MKKKRKRTNKNLTRRESALLERIRAGKTITEAAREVGYSAKWPGQAGSQAFKNIQRKRPEILYELGLTVQAVLEQLKASENI
jgi:predicted transcriptional regulator